MTIRKDRRWLAWPIGVVVGVTGLVTAVVVFDNTRPTQFCTADGRIGSEGQIYGRDPDQNCQFVDENGRIVP